MLQTKVIRIWDGILLIKPIKIINRLEFLLKLYHKTTEPLSHYIKAILYLKLDFYVGFHFNSYYWIQCKKLHMLWNFWLWSKKCFSRISSYLVWNWSLRNLVTVLLIPNISPQRRRTFWSQFQHHPHKSASGHAIITRIKATVSRRKGK